MIYIGIQFAHNSRKKAKAKQKNIRSSTYCTRLYYELPYPSIGPFGRFGFTRAAVLSWVGGSYLNIESYF